MSGELKATVRHSGVYSAAALLNRGAAFAIIPLYTHFLSTAEYGILGLITVASEIIGTLLGMGLGLAMTRLYFDYEAGRSRNEVVSTVLLFFAGACVLFLVPYAFASESLAEALLEEPGRGKLLFLGTTGLLLNSAFTLGLQYLRTLQRSTSVLVASTVRSILYLGLSALWVAGFRAGVDGAVTAILIANALVAFGLVGKILYDVGPRFSREKLRGLLAFGFPVLPGSLAEFALVFLDRFLLLKYVSLGATGVYFLGLRLGGLLYALLVAPFGQIYATRRMKAFGEGLEDAEASRVFTLFFALVAWASLLLALFAPEVVALVGTDEYAEATIVVPLIALTQVVLSVLLITQLGFFYAKRSALLMATSIGMLVVHAPLCWALVAHYGLVGAAIAPLASGTFKLAFTVWLARGLAGPRPEWPRLAAILVGALVCYGAGALVDFEPAALDFALRALLGLAFAALLFWSPLVSSSERRALFERLGRYARVRRTAS